MSEPWKETPLTMSGEQRATALRILQSARTYVRCLDLAPSTRAYEHRIDSIERRLCFLQRVLEGKVTL